MLTIEEARGRILSGLRATGEEIVGLAQAHARISARPIRAGHTQPLHDLSAMDGYAVRAQDIEAGMQQRVIGTARAGVPFAHAVRPDEAVRVFTGSVVPEGADAILPQEDATLAGDRLKARTSLHAGQFIRAAGQDFEQGDAVIAAGERLNARAIGLAAACGQAWITVRRRPRIAVLATGDELTWPGETPRPGSATNSNAPMLAAMIAAEGGEPIVLPIAPDREDALADALGASLGADMLVTIGGASVGTYDLVRAALQKRGSLDFWKIAMRPGKPLLFGQLVQMPVLGLPGNPASAAICAIQFLLPAIRTMLGMREVTPKLRRAVIGHGLKQNDHRADHLRGRLLADGDGQAIAVAFDQQDSSHTRLLAQADCLILRAPHAPAAAAGEVVDLIELGLL